MKFCTTITLIFLFYGCLIAQTDRLCFTDSYHPNTSANLLKHNNSYIVASELVDLNTSIRSNTKICLPVVVNNVYQNQNQKISVEAIAAQIESLNKDFNANNTNLAEVHPYFEELVAITGIEFYLLNTGFSEEQENSGINYYKTVVDTFNMNSYPNIKNSSENGLNGFGTKNYINIWVGNIEAGIKGYASMPTIKNSEDDGIVIHYKNFGRNNKTLTHEMGHFLGLKHLFGNEENSCEEDDGIKDTPGTATAYKTCITEKLVVNQCNDPYFEYDLTNNFMNLCNDDCLKMFTKGQKVKMLHSLLSYRKRLLQNDCTVLANDELDISIINLNTLPFICDNEFTLNYEICNVGKSEINSFTFQLQGFIDEQVETQITAGHCIEYSRVVNISKIRANTFTAKLTNINNLDVEENLRNNTAIYNFREASLAKLPFEETIDNEGSLLLSENEDNYNWNYLLKDEVLVNNSCYVFKPHPQNELSVGSLYSPVFTIDDSNSKTLTISFNMAYPDTLNNLILDDLYIEQINACADSTYQFLAKVNLVDAVVNLSKEQLLAQSNNNSWPVFSYDFEAPSSIENLTFKVTYISASRSPFYIDNFEIATKNQVPLNIQTYINQNKAGFYPNPVVDGTVHFYAERHKGNLAEVSLYNQSGKSISNFKLNNYSQVDLSNLPNGHYYVTFNWNNKIVSKKLVLLK